MPLVDLAVEIGLETVNSVHQFQRFPPVVVTPFRVLSPLPDAHG